MQKIVAAVLAAFAVLPLATAAQANDKVTYVIDWFPGGDESFPYVAQKEGIFAKNGLDVTLLVGRGSSDVITRLGTGVVDFGSGGIAALFGGVAEHQVPVKATMSVFSKQPDTIFVTEGSPITKITDLKGKTVATATFSSSNVLWPVVARTNGLDPDSVNLLKVDPTTLAALLAGGKVDATINWLTDGPETANVLKNTGKKLVAMPWSKMGLDGYGLSVYASDKQIKEHPDTVARFNASYFEGMQIAMASCKRAADDLHALVPQVEPEVAVEQCEVANSLIKNEVSAKTGIGNLDPALLRADWEWVAKSLNYKMDLVNPEAVVDRRFIPKSGS